MYKKSKIWSTLYLIMGILIVLTHACKKDPSTKDLLTAVKWQVTDVCGPVGDPYIYIQSKRSIETRRRSGSSYSTWSLKNNDKVLVLGVSEEKIIALTETELKLKGYDLFDCVRVFKAIPF